MRRFVPAMVGLMALPALGAPPITHPERLWTLGPTFHYVFGGDARGWSLGLEVSHWWIDHAWNDPDLYPYPVGLDIGMEWDFHRPRKRIYAEAQTGLLTGLSLGPFLDFPSWDARGSEPRWTGGLQGSAWTGFAFIGDLRFRVGPEGYAIAPGLIVKVPDCEPDCGNPLEVFEMIGALEE